MDISVELIKLFVVVFSTIIAVFCCCCGCCKLNVRLIADIIFEKGLKFGVFSSFDDDVSRIRAAVSDEVLTLTVSSFAVMASVESAESEGGNKLSSSRIFFFLR